VEFDVTLLSEVTRLAKPEEATVFGGRWQKSVDSQMSPMHPTEARKADSPRSRLVRDRARRSAPPAAIQTALFWTSAQALLN